LLNGSRFAYGSPPHPLVVDPDSTPEFFRVVLEIPSARQRENTAKKVRLTTGNLLLGLRKNLEGEKRQKRKSAQKFRQLFEMKNCYITTRAGFEPTLPKEQDFKSCALDHSATVPC
jgi:hypothetical protein